MTLAPAIFGCAGPALTAKEAAFFRDANPWGFILFARNISTPAQVLALTDALRAAVGRDAPVLIDQEGGRVQRMRAPHWREFAPAMQDGARANAEESLELRYRLIAHELRSVGIDVNCAPLLDIPIEGAHDVIGERALSRNGADVTRLGHAVRRGLTMGGVLPVIKHMPGHGRSMVDTHFDLPRVVVDRATLEQDFAPFRAHNDALMGMSAHLVYEAVDPDACGTQSAVVTNLIRSEIGFDGLLMTDDISMGALSGSIAERSRRALDAGCDVVLHCNGDMDEMQSIAGLSQALTGDALRRARAVDAAPRTAAPFDVAAAEDRYRDLTKERMDA